MLSSLTRTLKNSKNRFRLYLGCVLLSRSRATTTTCVLLTAGRKRRAEYDDPILRNDYEFSELNRMMRSLLGPKFEVRFLRVPNVDRDIVYLWNSLFDAAFHEGTKGEGGEEEEQCDYLMHLVDDVVLETPDFDEILIRALKSARPRNSVSRFFCRTGRENNNNADTHSIRSPKKNPKTGSHLLLPLPLQHPALRSPLAFKRHGTVLSAPNP